MTNGTLTPNRGAIILVLGILGWLVCPITGIFAWVMGNTDLAEMDAGRMDPEGRGLTQAGRILGIVVCAFYAIGMVLGIGFLLFAGVFGLAANQ